VKNFYSEFHAMPTAGAAAATDGQTDRRTAASRVNIVMCSRHTDSLHRRGFCSTDQRRLQPSWKICADIEGHFVEESQECRRCQHGSCKGKGKGKGEVKVHPRTGHEGPDVAYRHSSTLSLTSVLDGVGHGLCKGPCNFDILSTVHLNIFILILTNLMH